jgi:hypothetical protein
MGAARLTLPSCAHERTESLTAWHEMLLDRFIPYTLAPTPHAYHPDVLVQLADGRRLLAEIKHLFEMATALSQAKHAAAWHRCSVHGVGLLITDLCVTHTQLMQRTVPSQTVAVRRPAGPVAAPMRHHRGCR